VLLVLLVLETGGDTRSMAPTHGRGLHRAGSTAVLLLLLLLLDWRQRLRERSCCVGGLLRRQGRVVCGRTCQLMVVLLLSLHRGRRLKLWLVSGHCVVALVSAVLHAGRVLRRGSSGGSIEVAAAAAAV
jgi:hypothetical protein